MLFYIRWSEKASLERRLLSRDTSNVRKEGMWTPGRAGIPGQWEHACRSPEVALACKSEEWQGEQQGWSMKGRLGSAGGKQERRLSEKNRMY